MTVTIRAQGLDPATGEVDPHGMPQIACPARQDDVNPQFTCRTCPCATRLETHEAVDDLGLSFHVVDAVDCGFEGAAATLPTVWHAFPTLLESGTKAVPPKPAAAGGDRPTPALWEPAPAGDLRPTRPLPAVACPLLASPDRFAALSLLVDGVRWIPIDHCRDCQFHRSARGVGTSCSMGAGAGMTVLCAAPVGEGTPG